MKKILLLILIIVVILVVFVFGMIKANKRLNVNNFSIDSLTSKSVEILNDTMKLNIDVRTAKVTIKSGSQNTILLSNVVADQYKINQNGDKLMISESDSNSHQMELGKSPTITIVVSKEILDSIDIHQLNGTLNLCDIQVRKIAILHQNGTTEANSLEIIEHGKLSKHNGATNIHDLRSDGLKVTVKNGQFKLNGEKKISSGQTFNENGKHPLTINSGSGQVTVDNQ
ncbi:DUF4097 family beta strand repeat-containing protein [Companilactobacillus furfuricola]|uniref:DUF4097 family beta strand repeat-containing protein n=1 Tax=Companilactobacillus furfuricola TaxID=1462575 RepID=UPI0013DDCE87|nr:DUF4097 family beta strand repeat-containing protein [Companilactobacillus furfuricola]